jgi:hypothetical protein
MRRDVEASIRLCSIRVEQRSSRERSVASVSAEGAARLLRRAGNLNAGH